MGVSSRSTGHLSGAHINPSVTIAFTLTRHFSPRDAAAYIAAQLTGATLAALVLLGVWGHKPVHLGATLPTIAAASAFLYEGVMTAFLMFVIMPSRLTRGPWGPGPRSRSAV